MDLILAGFLFPIPLFEEQQGEPVNAGCSMGYLPILALV
jgi:hypothetical protein